MDQSGVTSDAAAGGMGMIGILIYVVILAFYVFVFWKIFTKAGKPGWAIFVPIYNIIVMLQIIGRPLWWILLFFIPLVNIVIGIILAMDMAVSFGKSKGWGVLMLAILGFIGYPMLALSDASYKGPAVQTS